MNPVRRLRAHAQGAVLRAKRGAIHVNHLYRGQYRGFRNVFGLPLEKPVGPLTRIRLDRDLTHTFDFLPDRNTLTGVPMMDTPHAAFARAFLSDPDFHYRDSAYYRRTVDGTLAVPSAGVPHAEWRVRNFIYVIRAIASEGYLPSRAPISVVECSDGRLMAINGKHRLAALMALGQQALDVFVFPANEFIATVEPQVRRLWPPRYYAKQYTALKNLGRPLANQHERVGRLLQRIRDAKLEEQGDIYHPLPFHDFRELRSAMDSFTPYQRLAMILGRQDDWVGKNVLDIGCNLGFYSFSLARRGATTLGIDLRPEYVEIASELADLYSLPCRFRESSVTPEMIRSNDSRYDATLCFSMLQWVIEQQGEAFGLEVLSAISDTSTSLFFDVAVNSGRAQLKSRRGEEIGFTYDLLRRGTTYPNIEYIGDVEPWGDPRYVFHCFR